MLRINTNENNKLLRDKDYLTQTYNRHSSFSNRNYSFDHKKPQFGHNYPPVDLAVWHKRTKAISPENSSRAL